MSAAPIYESVDAAGRLMAVDSDADSLENTNPIFGVDEAPDLSFKDAAKCAGENRFFLWSRTRTAI